MRGEIMCCGALRSAAGVATSVVCTQPHIHMDGVTLADTSTRTESFP